MTDAQDLLNVCAKHNLYLFSNQRNRRKKSTVLFYDNNRIIANIYKKCAHLIPKHFKLKLK